MYVNSLKYCFRNFINWERKGNFKVIWHIEYTGIYTLQCMLHILSHDSINVTNLKI